MLVEKAYKRRPFKRYATADTQQARRMSMQSGPSDSKRAANKTEFPIDPGSLGLGDVVRFMDGNTSVLSGRVIGLLQAPTVSKTTVLLGGIKPETGETVERSRLVLPDWLDGGPDRWIEEMPF
jgi:hypothetical protein